ncbi:MAG: cell division protein FtsQ/DivIB [Cellulosilyticaceae bacterium]
MKDTGSKIQKRIIYIGCIGSLIGIVFLLLPMWNINEINVEKINFYEKQEILDMANIKEGMHLLSISKTEIVKKIEKLPYVGGATVEFEFPNKVNIIIQENTPIGYVPFNGTYLCLNTEGQVLSQTDKILLELPIIQGIEFDQFKKDESLKIKNEEHFITANEMITILREYEFLDQVDSIDISNMEQIHLYVDKLDVIIGNIREFDKKVMWLKQVHKDYTMGILDLSMIHHEQAILTPLT